jgi:outer membrane protein assembly factor BamA
MAKLIGYKLIAGICMLMCCCAFYTCLGQNIHRLVINTVDKDSDFVAKNLSLKSSFDNSTLCTDYVIKLPSLLQSKGYISASLDSVVSSDSQTIAYVFVGDNYGGLHLHIPSEDYDVLQQSGLKSHADASQQIKMQDYELMQDKLLDYFENNGYPFAKVSLDSIAMNEGSFNANLKIDKGPLYHIDSLRLFGSAKISRNFIHRYLNIERGSLYQKDKLEKINQRLLELPYLEQSQPWNLNMLNTGSVVNLYLQPKKSNQVNVLAGFLPSNQQLGGKLLLTVDANLQLQNAFGNGESVGLVWQQIQPKSPRLHLQYTQPYLFNSPFGVDFLFELYKKDSTFLNISGQLGLLYMLSPNRTGKVTLQTLKTNVLDVDTFRVKAFRQLPDIADVSSLNLGVDYDVNNTDYRFNPRRGNEFTVSAIAGNKTIRKNTAITQIKDPSFNYNSLYDTLKLNSYQWRLRFKGAQYFKLGKQSVLKAGVNAGWYESPTFFRNELFQIGGYRLLRGFDEESIYANQYAVGTLEYRYLVGLNSNFFVFSDFGFSNNKILKQSNGYVGAGVGLSFETKGGIFNISYAVGKRNDLNFDIKQSKIHFGYISIF